jgi:hypothetical protein
MDRDMERACDDAWLYALDTEGRMLYAGHPAALC